MFLIVILPSSNEVCFTNTVLRLYILICGEFVALKTQYVVIVIILCFLDSVRAQACTFLQTYRTESCFSDMQTTS